MENEIVLYSYWRSSASWRIRISLNLKNIPHSMKYVNLLKKEHKTDEFKLINPNASVPALTLNGKVYTQSVAILELLEELYNHDDGVMKLLPAGTEDRAIVRALVQQIASDIHPLQNLKVLQAIGDDGKAAWAKRWISDGFTVYEAMLAKTCGKYCFGDQVTLADVCLIPQIYNAERWGVDMSLFPLIKRIADNCGELQGFKDAIPAKQKDAQ